MIVTREISIRITESNYQYYDELGYDTAIGETIVIPVELLPKCSHQKIKCECDGCGVEKDVIFKNYLKYDNEWGQYYCRKCSEKKRKETLRKNHGVDYPIQNKNILGKMRETLVQRYGVDNIAKRKTKNE